MYRVVIIILARLRYIPHYLKSPKPEAYETSVFKVIFIPLNIERQVTLMYMLAIPTPAKISLLPKWPTNPLFITSMKSDKNIEITAGIPT